MTTNVKTYFYKLLYKYLSLYLQKQDSILEIHPQHEQLSGLFSTQRKAVLCKEQTTSSWSPSVEIFHDIKEITQWKPDYLLLNGNIHYETDIQRLLEDIHAVCEFSTRLIITYYSSLWNPLIRLATFLGLRDKTPEQNWVAPADIDNLLLLAGFESVRRDQRVLIPIYIPLLSSWINRYLAPLPFFRLFAMLNILVARPLFPEKQTLPPSVSIVVPARNEAGNIEQAIIRLPKMGPDDELIFVEGHSTDNTWHVIQEMSKKYEHRMTIKIARQDGKGKGDAVRKGFALASKNIVMILDADLTVPPEDLPKFYHALVSGKGEFINGSRLVYPMEKKAMRFWNIVGNKFFATAFSFMLGQRLKDTLCGTKALTRENYLKIAAQRSYFGDFDPFGDFDLLFGASQLGLKIVEIPITYKERTYGDTNIQRWRHGVILFRMLMFAARKIKFL
jgi:hypothetical protein